MLLLLHDSDDRKARMKVGGQAPAGEGEYQHVAIPSRKKGGETTAGTWRWLSWTGGWRLAI